jgi:hypothetical protein
MNSLKILLSSFLLIISGCTFNPFFQDNLPKKDKLFAENYIDVLQSNDIDMARSFFSDELSNSNTEWLDTIVGKINQEKVKNKKLVYQKIISKNNPYRATLSYELDNSNNWLLIELTIDKINDNYKITGLYYYPMSGTFEDLTTFKIISKPFTHYLMLIISTFVLILIVYALIVCVRAPIKKKWLWIIFILIGISKISFVWSYGTFDFQLISFQLLGVGVMKYHPYGSWILSTSIPLGAIVFIFKRKILTVPHNIDAEKIADSITGG